jgi:hypothetical protein
MVCANRYRPSDPLDTVPRKRPRKRRDRKASMTTRVSSGLVEMLHERGPSRGVLDGHGSPA